MTFVKTEHKLYAATLSTELRLHIFIIGRIMPSALTSYYNKYFRIMTYFYSSGLVAVIPVQGLKAVTNEMRWAVNVNCGHQEQQTS